MNQPGTATNSSNQMKVELSAGDTTNGAVPGGGATSAAWIQQGLPPGAGVGVGGSGSMVSAPRPLPPLEVVKTRKKGLSVCFPASDESTSTDSTVQYSIGVYNNKTPSCSQGLRKDGVLIDTRSIRTLLVRIIPSSTRASIAAPRIGALGALLLLCAPGHDVVRVYTMVYTLVTAGMVCWAKKETINIILVVLYEYCSQVSSTHPTVIFTHDTDTSSDSIM